MGGTAEVIFRPCFGDGRFFYFCFSLIFAPQKKKSAAEGDLAMQITKELVEYVAELSRIKLDEQSAVKMEKELGAIVEYMEVLKKIDTDNIEPLSHVFNITNVMRDDEIAESYDREDILKNAPEHTDETVVVPKTVE